MAYYLSEPAPGKTDLTAKNRVWGIFPIPNRTRQANRQNPQQPRRENRLVPTKTASGIPYWPSRDPIEENGGVNLYAYVSNQSLHFIEYLGLQQKIFAHNGKLMIEVVHEKSIDAHKAAEKEWLDIIKSKDPTVPDAWNPNDKSRRYKPYFPREYGGRVCEKCTIEEDKTKTYSYYLTKKEGTWPRNIASAEIHLGGDTPVCNPGDIQVAWWHTHPSQLDFKREGRGNTKDPYRYKYYWGGSGTFSGKDEFFVNKNRELNPNGLPLFVTRRSNVSSMEWHYITEMHPGNKTKISKKMEPEFVDRGDDKALQ